MDKPNKFDSYTYYGSNEWLIDFRDHLNELIELRKTQKYELFFRVYCDESLPDTHEHRHICYMNDTTDIKNNAKKIIDLPGQDYRELKAFLRRMEDNYTVLIAKKSKGKLVELTENFFKI